MTDGTKSELRDVVAVSLATHKVRIMETGMLPRAAEAYVKMAVIRRGVEEEFFAAVPSGFYRDGDFVLGKKRGAQAADVPPAEAPQRQVVRHLIEIDFDDLGERDRAYEAIEKLLGDMGKIGTLITRTISAPDDLLRDAARYRWIEAHADVDAPKWHWIGPSSGDPLGPLIDAEIVREAGK